MASAYVVHYFTLIMPGEPRQNFHGEQTGRVAENDALKMSIYEEFKEGVVSLTIGPKSKMVVLHISTSDNTSGHSLAGM